MNRKRLVTWLLVAAMLIAGMPVSLAEDEPELVQSDAPNADNCVIYNYASDANMAPTLYVWKEYKECTYRVYTNQTSNVLIGSARSQVVISSAIVPLDSALLPKSGGNVYVSRQLDGESESERVAVRCPVAATPHVGIRVSKMDDPEALLLSTPGSGMTTINYESRLQAGSYYCAEVYMDNFTKIQNLTLPIKYNPEVLELRKLKVSTVKSKTGYAIDTRDTGAVTTSANGDFLDSFMITTNDAGTVTMNQYEMGGNPSYGIGVYPDLCNWGATQDTDVSSEWAQTPYVNTETGLIKLEFSRSGGPKDVRTMYGTGASKIKDSITILRIYFKCIAASNVIGIPMDETSLALHFATEADAPAGVTDDRELQKYCCLYTPNGYKASIMSLNLMAPPMSTKTTGIYADESMVLLSTDEAQALPKSLTMAENIRILVENHVKVYNYTNSSTNGAINRRLDSTITDVLILTPTSAESNGAAKSGDIIKVYVQESDNTFRKIGEYAETEGGDGGAVIDLGTDNLSPNGGSVFVTVTRANVESAKIEVPYDRERNRDVYFKINSSGFVGEDGTPAFAEPNSSTGKSAFTVKKNDQLRVDIYFNDFDDLLGYSFDLSFNPDVLQASDSQFHVLQEDGYISEQEVSERTSCLKIGSDLLGVTLTEEIIYVAWNKYKKGEISNDELQGYMQQYNLTQDEFEAVADHVQEKIDVSAAFGGDVKWNGGLLFNGQDRNPNKQLYPYIDNYNGSLKFASASLLNPPLVLHRDEDTGYHFLSVYFVAAYSGEPRLTITGAQARQPDGSEFVFPADDTYVVLSGPGAARDTSAPRACELNFTAHWNLYTMEKIEKTAQLKLVGGNGLPTDNNSKAVFLYNKYGFCDPGYALRGEDDQPLSRSLVTRYYYDASGVRHDLPDWQADESIQGFEIPAGQTSATYDLIYEYTYNHTSYDEEGVGTTAPLTVSETRQIYVVFLKGDMNGDGKLNLFDEQFIQSGKTATITDPLYTGKTYLEQEELNNWLLGVDEQEQDYPQTNPPPPEEAEEKVSMLLSTFKIKWEFYAAGARPGSTPLDPLKLPAGKEVIAVAKYQNLSALAPDGIYNLALSFAYNPDYFTLNGFTEQKGDSETLLWNSTAKALNESWISEVTKETTLASASAYDGHVYIQYINIEPDIPAFGAEFGADDSLEVTMEQGVLAAFSFTVREETFDESAGVVFAWEDYALTTMNGEAAGVAMDRIALLEHERFATPLDVTVAAEEKETSGTITLDAGNATAQDVTDFGDLGVTTESVFIYSGYGFRDPGFTVTDSGGQELDKTSVRRYFIDENGTEVELPAWTSEEVLSASTYFHVRNDSEGRLKYSDCYELFYACGSEEPAASRTIYVIFKRGDVNRDGFINVGDSSAVNSEIANVTRLILDDTMYFRKSADVNPDKIINIGDSSAISSEIANVKEIVQDYQVNERLNVMIF